MVKILAVMVGGGLGSAGRYGLFLIVQRLAGPVFPVGTLTVNLLGSLIIGFFWSIFDTMRITNEMRLFLFTGLVGGFTTFSTFTRETAQMFKAGEWKSACAYVLLSNFLGIVMVFCGFLLARRLLLLLK